MKFLVLGNSNSILKDGWFSLFKKIRCEDEFVNLSIGGSQSPALIYQLLSSEKLTGEFNAVIIEPTVVDHGEGWMNPNSIYIYARDLLKCLNKYNGNVKVLILPRKAKYILSPSQGMLAWAICAQEADIDIIDVRSELIELASLNKLELQYLWRDDMGHLTVDAQKIVAQKVNECINKDNYNLMPLVLNEVGYRAIDGAELAAFNLKKTVLRETSLVSVDCMSIANKDTFKIPFGDAQICHGVSINYSSINQCINKFIICKNIYGEVVSKVNLNNAFLKNSPLHKFTASFIRFRTSPDVAYFEFYADSINVGDLINLELIGVLVGPYINIEDNSWRNYRGSNIQDISND
jgi:hypothetical protein